MYYFPWVISHHISPRLYNFDWFIHSSKCYIITATQNILCCQNKRHHMLHQFESNASNYYMILEAHIIISSLISSVWNMKSVLLSLQIAILILKQNITRWTSKLASLTQPIPDFRLIKSWVFTCLKINSYIMLCKLERSHVSFSTVWQRYK